MNPANSGGTIEVSVLRGAPISVVSAALAVAGASLTVAMIGPRAPPQTTGTAMANAASDVIGIEDRSPSAAPTTPTTTSNTAGATRWLA